MERILDASRTMQANSSESVAVRLNRFLADVERRALRAMMYETRHEDDALDIVQEAMMQLAVKYADKPETEWAPLFWRILNSKLRDFQRKRMVRQRVAGWLGRKTDEDELEAPDPIQQAADPVNTDPASVSHSHEAIASLEQGLSALPERQRQAFLLRHWEGLDVADTAKAMGCSVGSVKTHTSRAMQALRQILDNSWEAGLN